MKNIVGIIGAAVLLIGGLLALGWYVDSNDKASDATSDPEGLSIATSFYPLQFAAERIVGDLGVVVNVGAGKDPHDFEPTTQNILAMQRADLVILQGADFEPWGDDVMARLQADGVSVLLATAELDLREAAHDHGHEEDHEHEGSEDHEHAHEEDHHHNHEADHAHKDEDDHGHDHGQYDPHTWLDPVLFSQTVAHMAEKIAAIDAENAATYEANAEELLAELRQLDAEYQERLASCEFNEVITSHDAFSYVAERYNFSVHSIAGISTQDMPSATVLAELRAEAEEGIGAILLEENNIKTYGETLSRETGLETLSINPIAYIVPSGENYLTLMRSNLDTFATALKCNE